MVDLRRAVAAVGRTLVSAGIIILLFAGYQLWGTGLAEARSQRQLRDRLEAALRPGAGEQAAAGDDSAAAEPAGRVEGEAVGIIAIPSIDLEKAVVSGVGVEDLKKGPGHYPNTPLPGQPGNVSVAGHRTTYGAPFFRLEELGPGDEIVFTTRQGRFVYEVDQTRVVSPGQSEVLAPTEDNRLTLTTCHPRYSASQRLVVTAALVSEPVEPPAPPGGDAPEQRAVPAPRPADEAGLSGERAARGPALAWGAAAALVWLLTRLASRRAGRPVAYGLGVPVFAVVLFFFFENFARLLPANV